MRDINRIDGYMNRLGEIWKKYPDYRFGQMLMNYLGAVQDRVKMDLFFVEDEEFFDAFEECFNESMGIKEP